MAPLDVDQPRKSPWSHVGSPRPMCVVPSTFVREISGISRLSKGTQWCGSSLSFAGSPFSAPGAKRNNSGIVQIPTRRTPTMYVRVTGPDSMARFFSDAARNDKGAFHVGDEGAPFVRSRRRGWSLGARRASFGYSLRVHTSFQAQRNRRQRKVGPATLETSMNAAGLSLICVARTSDSKGIGVCVDPTDT